MEGAMQRYVIAKRDHHWVVSANGIALMICQQKKTAVQISKQASDLLRSEDRLDEEEAAISRSDIH